MGTEIDDVGAVAGERRVKCIQLLVLSTGRAKRSAGASLMHSCLDYNAVIRVLFDVHVLQPSMHDQAQGLRRAAPYSAAFVAIVVGGCDSKFGVDFCSQP